MIDLIKEIEKLKDNEVYDTGIDIGFQRTLNNTIDKALDLLNQYNIITAPKSIKLSEITKKLQPYYYDKLCVEAFCRNKKALGYKYYDGAVSDYVFEEIIVFDKNMKIIDLTIDILDELKWLYALWIAGTTIIDDLKECE